MDSNLWKLIVAVYGRVHFLDGSDREEAAYRECLRLDQSEECRQRIATEVVRLSVANDQLQEQPDFASSPIVRGPEELPKVGDAIGLIRLDERIATGGSGRLYRATRPGCARELAVKFLNRGYGMHGCGTSVSRSRFQHEIHMLARLAELEVPTYYDSGEFRGRPFFVMSYIRGETLRSLIEAQCPVVWHSSVSGRSLDGAYSVLNIVMRLARTIAKLNERGVVHLDIKPENVIVSAGDVPYLIDFGSALDFRSVDETEPVRREGTPPYMAPERQARGSGMIEGRTDVFSLGVVIYECLCGCAPFQHDDLDVLEECIARRSPPREPFETYRIPRALENLCLSCLAKDPEQRPTAGDVAAALGPICN